MIGRRTFLGRLALSAAATALACDNKLSETPAPAERKPNIIYIMADDLGYGDLGCYGQIMIETPNIDRLAARGVRFTDHYAGSTVCAPSRCCLMTGLHTGHAYIRGNREVKPVGQEPLPAGTVTVARLLKDAGYATALCGKWGLGGPGSEGHPNNEGFDYFFGYLCQRHAHNYYPEFLWENGSQYPLEGNVLPEPKRPDGSGEATVKTTYSYDVIAEKAFDFIRRHREKPFFLYFSPTIPHANNEAGDHGMEVPDQGIYAGKDWPEQQKNLAAMISRFDSDIGRLTDLLKELGIENDTLVIFTSDNGPHREGGNDPDFFDSSGPFRGIKRDLYEGGIRVPLIASWPGRIVPAICSRPSAFWDFLPTACEAAEIAPPTSIDGISYLPSLLRKPQQEHDYLYWEFLLNGALKQAVRDGKWKAVRLRTDAPLELYDLNSDPGESTDISAEHPEQVRKMEAIMGSARTESKFWG